MRPRADKMNRKKILIIDDEEDFLKISKLNLESTGKFEVITLSSAKEIISHLHDFKPGIILLDLLMPGIGGIDACDMLNNDPIGKEVPILIVTALSRDSDRREAYKRGIAGYLVKPIEKDEIIAKIEKALQLKYGTGQ